MSKFDSVVSLNVGGHIYTTARSTLTRFRDSMLGAMFGGDFDALRDDQGRYFIDRNGRLFEHVLNFLRTTQMILPEDFKELPQLEMEADFYQIQPLIEALKNYKPRLETNKYEVVCLEISFGSIGVNASSTEVEEEVNSLMIEANIEHYNTGDIPTLLGILQENGFTVQSHNAYANDGRNEEKWVLVRITDKKSSGSK